MAKSEEVEEPRSTRPTPFEEAKSRLSPRTRTIGIPTGDGHDLAEEYQRAEQALVEARQRAAISSDNPATQQAAENAERVRDEALTALKPYLVEFTFKAIGGEAFDEMLDRHPATKTQRYEFRRRNNGAEPGFNTDTFPIELIATCCIDPTMTQVDVKELWSSDDLSEADRNSLLVGALSVNQISGAVDLGKGSKPTRH